MPFTPFSAISAMLQPNPVERIHQQSYINPANLHLCAAGLPFTASASARILFLYFCKLLHI